MNFLRNLMAQRLFATTDRRVDYIIGFILVILVIIYKLNKAQLL